MSSVGASAAAAAGEAAATTVSSWASQPKTVGGGAPTGAVGLGDYSGAVENGDRKRRAAEDCCKDVKAPPVSVVPDSKPPVSIVPDSTRPVLDGTTTATSAVAIGPADTTAADIAGHQSSLSSRSAAGGNSIRRGPPKKRICSDLASASAFASGISASAPSAEAVGGADAATARSALLSNDIDGSTRNLLINSSPGATTTVVPPVPGPGIHQQSSFQLAPSSIAAGAAINYWPNGRLDSMGSPSMLSMAGNATAGLSLPFPLSTTPLASQLLLLHHQRQLLGCPANIHDYNDVVGISAIRGMSTAVALAEIEAHELALARARAHQDAVSMALLDYHVPVQPMPHQNQAGPPVVGLLPGEGQAVVADEYPRKDAPATTSSHEEQTLAANSLSTGLHNMSAARSEESYYVGTSVPSGGDTRHTKAMLSVQQEIRSPCVQAEPITVDEKKVDEPNPATASRKKGPNKKKCKKKTSGSGIGSDVAPILKQTSRNKRPRVATTLSIFPETNTNSILLSHPEDGDLLSPYLCIIRKQIEVFVSTSKDIEAKLSVGGNKIPPVAGQIGLRCIHCKHIPFRDRAKSSESYPNLLKNIHQSVRNYQRHHWPKCKEIPDEVRKEVDACLGEKVSKSKGNAGQWWIRSCRDRGLFDAEEVEFLDESKKSGIFLVDNDTHVLHESETSSSEDEGEITTKPESRSPISVPNPAAGRSGLDVLLEATGIAETSKE